MKFGIFKDFSYTQMLLENLISNFQGSMVQALQRSHLYQKPHNQGNLLIILEEVCICSLHTQYI